VNDAIVNERKEDEEKKRVFCDVQEEILDMYYQQITSLLSDIENARSNEAELGLLVDFLCKNENPEELGAREIAAYARFDYITKVRLFV